MRDMIEIHKVIALAEKKNKCFEEIWKLAEVVPPTAGGDLKRSIAIDQHNRSKVLIHPHRSPMAGKVGWLASVAVASEPSSHSSLFEEVNINQ